MVTVKSLITGALFASAAAAQSTDSASSAATGGGASTGVTITIPAATITKTVEIAIPTYTGALDRNIGEWIDVIFPPCARNAVHFAYNESHAVCGKEDTFRSVRRCVCNHPRFVARALYGAEASCGRAPRWRVWWALQRECRVAGIRLGDLRVYVNFNITEFTENDPATWGNQTGFIPPDFNAPATVTAGTITITKYTSVTSAVAALEEQTSDLPPISETGVPTSTLPLDTAAASTASGSATSGTASASGSSSAAVGNHAGNLLQLFGVIGYTLLVAVAGFVLAL